MSAIVLTTAAQRETRDVRQSLDAAGDAQIAQVVALVDGMAERGAADALIARLRPRLAQLRPPRAPNFGRVLFTPLDAVIQPAPTWRRGALGLPRTAVGPLTSAVRQVLGDQAMAIDEMIRGAHASPTPIAASAGPVLWGQAAQALWSLPMPATWSHSTGLTETDFNVIRGGTAAVLEAATDIDSLLSGIVDGNLPPDAAPVLRRLVAQAATHGAFEAGLLLAVLLARIPASAAVLEAAEASSCRTVPGQQAAIDQAIDFQLQLMEDRIQPLGDIVHAGAELSRTVAFLNALEGPKGAHRPGRKSRVDALKRKVDTACRRRFQTELDERVGQAGQVLSASPTDAEVVNLESDIRILRRFESAARQLGGVDHYDRLLRGAADQAAKLDLPMPDRVRLVELLQGSEAAMGLLAKG